MIGQTSCREAVGAMESILQAVDQVRRSIRQVWWGRSEVVDLLLIALLAGGHVLAEDVPGVGKTTLLKSLVRSLGLGFRRIQCTPDLLPADVVGTTYFEQRSGEWRFRPGPILSQVVLADEINRATPRTQSALLEAMEERQVTVDGETHPCPRPFLLLATQNPVELEGTFPLPEAQVDRFLLRLRPGYPSAADEQAMVARHAAGEPLAELQPVLTVETLLELQRQVAAVRVAAPVLAYLVAVVRATRENEAVRLGASPRASLALYRACQALALLRGRHYILPDDVKALSDPVLGHRLILSGQARLRGQTAEAVLQAGLAQVPVPAEPLATGG